ncbi:MAG: hypothetical protein KC503_38605 [Myxococcales bacterium]|nr:hypothetical protein [Myxococcales bacterium]
MLGARPAHAVDLELDLGLLNRVAGRVNGIERLLRYDPTRGFLYDRYLTPANTSVQYSFLARVAAQLSLARWLSIGFAADSGEVRVADRVPGTDGSLITPVPSSADETRVTANGRRFVDEAKSTFFIRQAYIELAAPSTRWMTLRAGRLAASFGRGVIYDDFGLGGELSLHFDKLSSKVPLRLDLQGLIPTRSWSTGMQSVLLSSRLSWVLSSMLGIVEAIGISAAYFHDGNNNFGALMQPMLTEVAVDVSAPQQYADIVAALTSSGVASKADVVWFGLDAKKLIGDFSLYGAVYLELGSVTLDNPLAGLRSQLPPTVARRIPGRNPIEVDTFGVAVDLRASYLLTERLAIGAFLLFLSGEGNPFLDDQIGSRYSSFLGVVPYMTHTNLFFSGGLNETFSGRQAAASGVNGRGVIAFGPTARWEITEKAALRGSVVPLLSAVPSASGGRFYGVEIDAVGSFQPWSWLRLSVEYDVLIPGSFFAGSGAVHKAIVGVDLLYGI